VPGRRRASANDGSGGWDTVVVAAVLGNTWAPPIPDPQNDELWKHDTMPPNQGAQNPRDVSYAFLVEG